MNNKHILESKDFKEFGISSSHAIQIIDKFNNGTGTKSVTALCELILKEKYKEDIILKKILLIEKRLNSMQEKFDKVFK